MKTHKENLPKNKSNILFPHYTGKMLLKNLKFFYILNIYYIDNTCVIYIFLNFTNIYLKLFIDIKYHAKNVYLYVIIFNSFPN